MNAPQGDHDEAERLSIGQIFGLIAGGWRIIVCLTICFMVVAVFLGLTSKKMYHSYYVVMPAPTADDPFHQTSLSVDVLGRQSKTPDWDMYVSSLTSTTLADGLVKRTDILQQLFPAEWDSKRKTWNLTQDFASLSLSGKVKSLMGTLPPKQAPDKFTLLGYLAQYLNIQQPADVPQMTVSIDSPDPKMAIVLLTALHQSANDLVREARLRRAVGQRQHLLAELQTTTVSDYRQTLLTILGRVETNAMTASISGEYAAILVDGPVTQPNPIYPNTSLFLKLAVVSGVAVGMILVVFFPISDALLIRAWRMLLARFARLRERFGSSRRVRSISAPGE